MRLSDLQSKKIISVISGKSLGTIIDIDINSDGSIDSLIIEPVKNVFSLSREGNTRVYWNEISKIGVDVILVKEN